MTDSVFVWRADEPTASDLSFAVKDNIAVRGAPTTAGTRALGRPAADRDAECVALARASGWTLVGTTNMDELALGNSGFNQHYGWVRNPRAPGRIAGGSSGGSAAAVASGQCRAAFGTDTGGSIRVPAALCGVVGLRPRPGYISADGVVPLSPTLDSVGVIARDCHDVALLLAAAHPDPGSDVHPPDVPLRLGRPPESWLADVSDEVRTPYEELVAAYSTTPIVLPDRAELSSATLTISLYEAARTHAGLNDSPRSVLGPGARSLIATGSAIGPDDYRRCVELVRAWGAEIRAALAAVDALVLPTTPMVAPPLVEEAPPAGVGSIAELCRPFSGCQVAALSIPIPRRPLPVGVQIVARTESEALRVGAAVEARLRGDVENLES